MLDNTIIIRKKMKMQKENWKERLIKYYKHIKSHVSEIKSTEETFSIANERYINHWKNRLNYKE